MVGIVWLIEGKASAEELGVISRFIVRGHLERARVSAAGLVERYPTDPVVLALVPRLDAETNRTSFAAAEATVRRLLADHPGEMRLRATAAYLVARQGDADAAIAELRDVARQSDEPYVHQTLAGLLHLNRSTWGEAWEHYKVALRAGPLASPCYRSAAYKVGRAAEPESAQTALTGAGPFERAGVHTRALGPTVMFLVADLLTLGATAIRLAGLLPTALAVMALATLWAGWAVWANHIVCCRKCRNTWLAYIGLLWVVFAATPTFKWFGVVAAIAAIGTLTTAVRAQRRQVA